MVTRPWASRPAAVLCPENLSFAHEMLMRERCTSGVHSGSILELGNLRRIPHIVFLVGHGLHSRCRSNSLVAGLFCVCCCDEENPAFHRLAPPLCEIWP